MKIRSGHLRWARVMGFGALLLAMVIGGMGRGGRVAAQEATPAVTVAAVVNVVGHGSATVEPDLATTSIGVTISNPSLSEAQGSATTTMNAIIDALKEAGVDEKDIQTSSYSVNVVSNYDNMGNPTEVSGYQVSNVAQVIIRDIDTVGDILEAGVAAGANTIYGVTFAIADPKSVMSDARAAAVADAKATAEELAAASGLTLGRVLSVSEGVDPSIPYAANSQFAGGKGGGGIAAGTMEITVDVVVTYELV
jgi:uncharacterized protein YggE